MAASSLRQWLTRYVRAPSNPDDMASILDFDKLELLMMTLDQDVRCDEISTVKCPEGKTALDYAVELGHRDIIRVMLRGLNRENQSRLLWMSPHLYSFELPSWTFRGFNYLTAFPEFKVVDIPEYLNRTILLLSFGYM